MSEFKFACPVCGQHIKCDSTKSGSQMECPTCFRKIVVPQAREDESSKLVLTASEVQSRPLPQNGINNPTAAKPATSPAVSIAVVALVVLVCAAGGAAFAFREKIFGRTPDPVAKKTDQEAKSKSPPEPKVIAPPASDTNWTLNLAETTIPEATAAGRINGHDFLVTRTILQGGTLNFRMGKNWPPELGLTVNLFA